MKGCSLLLLCLSAAHGQPSKRAADEECCSEKKVGDVVYTLLMAGQDTSEWKCKDGCVYKTAGQEGTTFCFKSGELAVECMDSLHWCYKGDCGPDMWASIKGAEGCGGKSQSPVDVLKSEAGEQGPGAALEWLNYDKIREIFFSNDETEDLKPECLRGQEGCDGGKLNGAISNNGHSAVLNVDAGTENGILRGGPLAGDYKMLQLHFHWGSDDTKGSEHLIEGKSFPMEMHIVHIKVGKTIEEAFAMPDGLAVVGQMFEVVAADNAALTPLLENLAKILKKGDEVDMTPSPFKVDTLLPTEMTYANYAGSLTTPTCDEIVNWMLFTKPIPISSAQLALFRALKDDEGHDLVDNFRPPQALNGRKINFFTAA